MFGYQKLEEDKDAETERNLRRAEIEKEIRRQEEQKAEEEKKAKENYEKEQNEDKGKSLRWQMDQTARLLSYNVKSFHKRKKELSHISKNFLVRFSIKNG